MQAKGRTGKPLKERVSMDFRAAGKSEIKCETSVAHIRWLESCGAFHEIIYRL